MNSRILSNPGKHNILEWFWNFLKVNEWKLTYQRFKFARNKRISFITRQTDTHCNMISNIALGINSTCSRTRIHTLVSLTSLVWGTIWVYSTFWPAGYIGISKIFRYTLASSCTLACLTIGIFTTRWWIARINNFCDGKRCCGSTRTNSKGVSFIARITNTAWRMISDIAASMLPTNTRTRICRVKMMMLFKIMCLIHEHREKIIWI